MEEKGKKEEAKDGQGTSGEQENKEVGKVVDKVVVVLVAVVVVVVMV